MSYRSSSCAELEYPMQAVTPRTAMIQAPELASPQFKADPYPFYARLRHEAPMYRTIVRLPEKRTAWLVTRYDDVVSVLRDGRLVKDPARATAPGERVGATWVPGALKPFTRNMLDLDAPDHTRLRALVQKAFTPRLVEGMRGRVEELAGGLLGEVGRRRHMDLIRDSALPIPTTVIAETLGVPVGDRHRFPRW